ncbi:MAG: hypothetical protein M0C28_07155 [Candidatus Moduliflexus flocculans]|nr:hypothetical protein [Candidatus Moduliflexus flocculans]
MNAIRRTLPRRRPGPPRTGAIGRASPEQARKDTVKDGSTSSPRATRTSPGWTPRRSASPSATRTASPRPWP